MPDIDSVMTARKKVAGAYKDWLKETYETQLSEMGSKKTREQLPQIDETGTWADTSVQSKPLAWIVEFRCDSNTGEWTAGASASAHPNRLGGSFNAKSPLQGVLSRILPVMRLLSEQRRAIAHPYWEWAFALVFPGRPVFRNSGSSGAVLDFDPNTGLLTSPIDGVPRAQPYVSAALFELVPRDDTWSEGDLHLTYGEATAALERYIFIAPAEPEAADSKENS